MNTVARFEYANFIILPYFSMNVNTELLASLIAEIWETKTDSLIERIVERTDKLLEQKFKAERERKPQQAHELAEQQQVAAAPVPLEEAPEELAEIQKPPDPTTRSNEPIHLEAANAEVCPNAEMCPITERDAEFQALVEENEKLREEKSKMAEENKVLHEEIYDKSKQAEKYKNNAKMLEKMTEMKNKEAEVPDDRKTGCAEESESTTLKSYPSEPAVSQDFHSKLIGEHITNVEFDEFDVNNQMPDKSKGDSGIIKTTGVQENAENAAKAVDTVAIEAAYRSVAEFCQKCPSERPDVLFRPYRTNVKKREKSNNAP